MSAADPLLSDAFPASVPGRPAWLVTLADLGLLLVGFFVLLQAEQSNDRGAITRALRDTFGGTALPAAVQPLPVAAAAVDGFSAGDSRLPQFPAALIRWAREQGQDDRTVLTVVGSTDGSDADVDPATGSASLLAVDRARAVAGALADAIPGVRLSIGIAADTAGPHRRMVQVSLGFAGVRQDSAGLPTNAVGRQPAPDARTSH